MTFPKIRFKEMTLQENIDFIKWAYFDDGEALSVHDFTIKYFSELTDLDSNLNVNEIYKKIEEVVTNYYNENKKKNNR